MPNAIKYNVSAETLALKKGNFWIGTGDVGKGPTSSTGYYNGITPPSGGFTIYLNKATGGPSIYTVNTEAQLTGLTSSIAGQSLTTSGACLNYFATQTDKMIFNIDYPAIVTNGLVLNWDAGFAPSYPTTATTWYDVSSGGNNGTLTNGPTYSSVNGGGVVFDGVDDRISLSYNPIYKLFSADTVNQTWSISMWVNLQSKSSGSQSITQYFNNIGPGLYLVFPFNNNLPLMWTDGQHFLYGNTTIVDKGLTNIVFQFDGNSTRKIWNIYLNGVLDATRTLTISNANFPLLYPTQTISSSGEEIKGSMCTYSVYNRALISAEINQNYYAILNSRMIVTDGLVLNLQAGDLNSYPGSGTVWKDVSGYGNNGTLTNSPTYSSTNGGSIVFDGVDDYAQITSPFGNIDWSSRAWSFSAWMKLGALGDRSLVNLNSANSTDYIVTNVFYGDGASWWYFIKNSASTQTNFRTPQGIFTTNEIFHFTMTYNGNGLSNSNISFYKNGVQVVTGNGGGAGLSNMTGLQIGGGNNYPMNGNVYNFLMYNRAISSSEVLQNYNAQKSRFGL